MKILTTTMMLIALSGFAQAKPEIHKASGERLGCVVLLADEGGQPECKVLQGLGFDTALVHSATPQALESELESLGKHFVLVGLRRAAPVAVAVNPSKVAGCVLVEPYLDANALPESFRAPLLLLPQKPQAPVCESLAQRAQGSEVKIVESGTDGLARDDDPVQKSVRRFLVAQSRLAPRGLAGVPFLPSPNWDVRPVRGGIDTVVVHSTVITTMAGTQRAFLDDKVRRVSAHYVVDRDGSIVQMVDERFTAWHAGVSELEGRTTVNNFSVGVELINLNDGVDPYPEAQCRALAQIIDDLRSRWKIPNSRIVSHAAIARPVGRKSDPLGFDFEKLYKLLR